MSADNTGPTPAWSRGVDSDSPARAELPQARAETLARFHCILEAGRGILNAILLDPLRHDVLTSETPLIAAAVEIAAALGAVADILAAIDPSTLPF